MNITKALRGVDDSWTDHRLLIAKVKLRLKPRPRSSLKQPTRKKLNLHLLKDPEHKANLTRQLDI